MKKWTLPVQIFRQMRRKMAGYFHTYSRWEILFCLSCGGFVAFGILACALGCRIGEKSFLEYSPFFTGYLPELLFSLGFGTLIYYLIAHLSRRHWIFKTAATLFLVLVFLVESIVFICVTLYGDSLFEDDDALLNEGWSYEDSHHKALIMDSQLFGPGPDAPFPAYHAEVSERQVHPLLPLLSSVYGYWILILFTVLSLLWLVSGVRVYLKIYRRWHEWLFLMSFLAYGYFLVRSVIGFTGLMPCVEFCPFAGMWELMCLFPVPVLSGMCAVLKLNNDAI